jgi:hypothetical protein
MTGAQRAGEANDQLTKALVNAAARGIRPRCGDYEVSHYWLSECEQERKQAARWCAGCLILKPCREVGKYQTFGVFGGQDFTRRPDRPRST